ncbi:MAG: RdgB/HAM1 family non-canonical purine NTP pyrophosphatase [Bacteroidetes bacterium]|nr:RdgB/HAM1 family non-canonical purine NTP pyrophosphatase [Bacteroidota bacterium]
MKKLLVASGNDNKVMEIRSVLSETGMEKILSLKDFGISLEVEENGITLEENAVIKAKAVFKLMGIPVISDDTGLFVDALKGEPGVYSARYAGPEGSYQDNCDLLLSNMKHADDKSPNAYFKCVICLMESAEDLKLFEGICTGRISEIPRGKNGFGYDPVFIPSGYDKTFAELEYDEKNKISHRGIALMKLKDYLIDLNKKETCTP